MQARISPAQDRVLWTASRFLLEFCIPKNFRNSLHTDRTIHAWSVSVSDVSTKTGAEDPTFCRDAMSPANCGLAGDTPAATAQLLGAFLRNGRLVAPATQRPAPARRRFQRKLRRSGGAQ